MLWLFVTLQQNECVWNYQRKLKIFLQRNIAGCKSWKTAILVFYEIYFKAATYISGNLEG